MDDFRILKNLFEKHNDQIHFDLFKESNIIHIVIITKGILIKKQILIPKV